MLSALSDAAGAKASDFSIDDYGDGGAVGPFQIMEPSYPAPKWLNRYVYLDKALRECQTLCTLRGRPYRVVRWGREGAGAKGGIPCKTCRPVPGDARFPKHQKCASCNGGGGAIAHPIAEFQPGGRRIVYDANGNAKIVGKPDYIVSRNPFPRTYRPRAPVQSYTEAIRAGQWLANREGKRVFLCSGFGADCKSKVGTPVVYVDPGGLARRYDNREVGTVIVNPVTPEYFQELVAESRGRSYLGFGT